MNSGESGYIVSITAVLNVIANFLLFLFLLLLLLSLLLIYDNFFHTLLHLMHLVAYFSS